MRLVDGLGNDLYKADFSSWLFELRILRRNLTNSKETEKQRLKIKQNQVQVSIM